MSFDAMSWAVKQKITKTSPQSHLLLIMANYANEQNECYPSISGMAKRTRLNEKTIRSCLKDLIKMGLIIDTNKVSEFGSKVYQLNLELVEILDECVDDVGGNTPTKIGSPTNFDPPTDFGSTPLPNLPPTPTDFGSTPLPNLVDKPINNTVKEPINNTVKNNKAQKPPKFDPLTIQLPNNVDYELWQGFVEMRKTIKKPLTEFAAKLLIKDLISFGDLANQSLEYSIKNNYQGLFMPKQNQSNSSFAKKNENNFFEQLAELDRQERANFGNQNFNPNFNNTVFDAEFTEYNQ